MPIVHCESCGIVPAKGEALLVVLLVIRKFSREGGNPLAWVKEWVERSCPQCRGEERRETDTIDTFVGSSWYFISYVDYHNEELITLAGNLSLVQQASGFGADQYKKKHANIRGLLHHDLLCALTLYL